MSQTSTQALARYVEVLDLRTKQAQTHATAAQAALQRTQQHLAKLDALREAAQLKKTASNVALYANAAGFRSNLMDVAAQFSDTYGVQQLELTAAQQQVQQSLRRHASVGSVLAQAQAQAAQTQSRKAQKSMDELAGQAWLRQRQASEAMTGTR